ncbi:hypothetical protein ACFL0M_01460 [Thermodesulfobacteriota bacterium]
MAVWDDIIPPEDLKMFAKAKMGDRGMTSHKVSLFDMHMKYADVVSLAEVIDYLETIQVNRQQGIIL